MKQPNVLELFERHVAEREGHAAIERADQVVTYGELDIASSNLANYLTEAGAAQGEPVAILTEDAVASIEAILGVLKAGCAFVPLDASTPEPRMVQMLSVVVPRWYVVEEKYAGLVERMAPGSAAAGRVVRLDRGRTGGAVAGGDGFSAYFNPRRPTARPDADGPCYIYFTSGSTGQPKAIAGRLKGIDHFIRWEIKTLGLGESTRVSQLLPFSFDGSLRDIFVPLSAGGTVCVPPGRETLLDPRQLAAWLDGERVEIIHCVPSLFRAIVNQSLVPELFRDLRYILMAGEPLLPADVKRWSDVFGERVQLVNLYGTSETTMAKFAYFVKSSDSERRSIPIGKPMEGAAALIVDAKGRPCPPGAVGEIYIRTPYRTLGYYNQPELTREVFIPNPFSDDPQDIVYKTGDLGRILEDGNFEYLGRRDKQVKIRGVRVELDEVEGVLRSHGSVLDVATVEREDAAGFNYLCAYVVLGDDTTIAELRAHCAGRLPDYMVPSAFVLMEELPRTISGKVDRQALPEPGDGDTEASEAEAIGPIEEMLSGIYAEVLGLRRVGRGENFFQLGGHSLSATRVVSRARAACGVGVALRDLFEAPTVAGLAEVVWRRRREAEGWESGAGAVPAVGRRAERGVGAPLSFAQQRLWFFDQLEPSSASYNIPFALRLVGQLNATALEHSLAEVVRRHESLRTTFTLIEGSPTQIVHAAGEWRLPLIDLTAQAEPQSAAVAMAAEEAGRPFDLERGPLLRASLLRLRAEEHVLLLTMHHIVSDGWSMGVLVHEAATLYAAYSEGHERLLPELSIQYGDYAAWQREWLQGETLEGHLAYWRRQLAGAPAELELPADAARPPVPGHRGAMEVQALSPELTAALNAFSRGHGATLFMTLLAAFKALLHRYTGQEEIIVGTPVAGRTRAEVEPLIGFFVNTLVLRTDLSGDPTFTELLGRVRETALDAYAHQDLPFEKLVEELQPERKVGRAPFVRVMFVFQNTPQEILKLPGLTLELMPSLKSMAEFDWVLNAEETGRGLFITFEYNTDLFKAETVRRLLAQLELLLAGIVAGPERRVSELPLLTEEERHRLLIEWDRSDVRPNGRSVHRMFEEQVARDPEAPAVTTGDARVSYAELDELANQVAHGLQAEGLRHGEPVAVMLEGGPRLVAVLYGVLKAGGHFVCLDPNYPAARLRQILQEVEPPCLIADARHLEHHAALVAELRERSASRVFVLDGEPAEGFERADWFETRPRTAPAIEVGAEDLAYIVYTSGSTGRPKGIMQTHEGLCQYVEWQASEFDIRAGKRVAQWASVTYDASYAEIFGALSRGAELCLASPQTRSDPAAVAVWLRDAEVSLLITVPSFARQLLQALEGAGPRPLPRMEALLLAGEVLPVAFADAWLARFPEGPRLYNLYGPTETVLATCYPVDVSCSHLRSIPIGRPIDGRHVLIVDGYGNLAPLGGKGEIHLRSRYLTHGYFRQPEETARAFIADPALGEAAPPVYRTGDLGRWYADGTLELLGRRDNQVKVRGMRVEPEEIEAALLRHEQVAACAVAAHEHGGDYRLCAYVAGLETPPAYVLRSFLREFLPEHMVPSAFVAMPELPRLPNGKLDRQRLPVPDFSRPEIETPYVAPTTEAERTVAEVWRGLLGVERIGTSDNFFDLGGHSLLATQAVNKLRNLCAVDLPLRALFEEPTVAGLARRIESAHPEPGTEIDPLARLLERVKGLTNEEVEALLAADVPSATGGREA